MTVDLHRSLVDAIAEDRRQYGMTRERAVPLAKRYEAWLIELQAGRAADLYHEDTVTRLLDDSLLRLNRMSAVYGPQGKGKTNLCAVLTEVTLACRPDWEVYSNVPYPWHFGAAEAPPRLHLVESLSELLRALSERALEGKVDAAIILDEFDQTTSSHSWQSETSESWSRFVYVKRHYSARGPLVVFHDLNWIPLSVRSGSSGSPFKLIVRNGEHVLADLEDPREWVATVGRSYLPYLTMGLRGFSLDVDMAELQSRLSGPGFAGNRKSVAQATIAFLDEQARKERAEAVRETEEEGLGGRARQLLQEGWTVQRVADAVGRSHGWVGNLRKELVMDGSLTGIHPSTARAPRTREGAQRLPAGRKASKPARGRPSVRKSGGSAHGRVSGGRRKS